MNRQTAGVSAPGVSAAGLSTAEFAVESVFYQGTYIRIETLERGIKKLVLMRPDVKNAMNAEMIAEISEQLARLSAISNEQEFRLLAIAGEGSAFCAGADLAYMKEQAQLGESKSYQDARNLGALFFRLANLPVPVLSFVQGAAIGGGLGLTVCSDYVLAADNAVFSTSEVRLGIVPGVISPYIVRKIGLAQSAGFMMAGNRMKAEDALQKGLANRVVPLAEFQSECNLVLAEFLLAGPNAARRTKQLLRKISPLPGHDLFEYTASSIAQARCSPEGQAGLSAYFEKKVAPWAEADL